MNSFDLAKTIGIIYGWKYNNLEINRLIFMTNVLVLGRSQGKNQFTDDTFYSGDMGPVLPKLFKFQSCFGPRPVKNIHWKYKFIKDKQGLKPLEEVVEITKKFTPGAWVAATHNEQGAWAKHYKPGFSTPISKDSLLDEYSKVYKKL